MSWLNQKRSIMAGVGAALLATGTGTSLVASPAMAGEGDSNDSLAPIKSHNLDRGFFGPGLLTGSSSDGDGGSSDEDQPSQEDYIEAVSDEVGFDKCQAENAVIVIETGKEMDMDDFGITVGLATVAQETMYRNLTSTVVPESEAHSSCGGSGSDHDSVGIFQQRHTMGWGSVEELMDPAFQSANFFERLDDFDYNSMELTQAAQKVQVSAHPDLYAQHEDEANDVLEAYQSV